MSIRRVLITWEAAVLGIKLEATSTKSCPSRNRAYGKRYWDPVDYYKAGP